MSVCMGCCKGGTETQRRAIEIRQQQGDDDNCLCGGLHVEGETVIAGWDEFALTCGTKQAAGWKYTKHTGVGNCCLNKRPEDEYVCGPCRAAGGKTRLFLQSKVAKCCMCKGCEDCEGEVMVRCSRKRPSGGYYYCRGGCAKAVINQKPKRTKAKKSSSKKTSKKAHNKSKCL